MKQAIQQAPYQQDLSNSQSALNNPPNDNSNSQSALNNAANDNKIANNDTGYTQSKNATVAKDAQSLENTNQQ
ncbi:hypothetical protein DDP51_08280, partial [Helicobacter pylori]